MTTDDKIRNQKLQYDISKEAAKVFWLPSGKLDKYEYLTGEEILPSDQRRYEKKTTKKTLRIKTKSK